MMRFTRLLRPVTLIVMALTVSATAAELRLASVFSDNVVLQRNKPLNIWGEADANAAVVVSLGQQRGATTADGNGRWRLSLPAMQASLAPQMLRVSSGGKEITVQNVLIGDVWLCSGQSNMQMGLREAEGGEAEVRDAAKQTRIRLLSIPKRASAKPEDRFDANWQVCLPASAGRFSAVGYFFAKELGQDPAMAEVPIGLIDSSFGGTAAEGWTSKEGLEPFKPSDLLDSMFNIKPAHLYNGMIAPLLPCTISGVLWYQGESNAARPEVYPRVLSAMIADWRSRFADPSLPFLIVQLPPYTDSRFTWVREAQAEVARTTPDVALAVTIDTTDGFDLHPKEKREVGRRLALLARRIVYKQNVIAIGPTFKNAKADGAVMRVTFETSGDGLAGNAVSGVKGFAVAGEDGIYRFADAMIEGDEVILRCPAVPSPKTVRYAWAGIPEAGLTNKSGLPAVPFRTDNQPRSSIEVQKQPVLRHVVTSAYDIEISGEGKVTSLAVRGRQFLSNAMGGAGGTSIPALFGPRALPTIRALGPDLLSCGDNDVTFQLAFKEQAMEWMLVNRGRDQIRFRIALATSVVVKRSNDQERIALRRGNSTLTITGVDSVADGEDGKVLEVVVKGGAAKSLELTVDAR